MITIRPGSHVHTLLSILPFVGEYPMSALRLLGSVRSYKDLIHKLTQVQEFRFPDSDERFTCRLLNVCGRGNRKTVRFHKSALPMLKRWDYEADAAEAICAGFEGKTAEEMGRYIADLCRNSPSHWSYIGSSKFSYIGVGVDYRAGTAYGWYGCVMVGRTNYG